MRKYKKKLTYELGHKMYLIHSKDDYHQGIKDGLRYAIHTIDNSDDWIKPVVPYYVSDWILLAQTTKHSLPWAMTADDVPTKVKSWIKYNSEDFARAWLNGSDEVNNE